jgi:lysophospholipase L1-like esterase
MDEEGWREAHEYNINLINNHLNQQQQKRNDDHNVSLDVVFLGDSIMEQWNGRHYGQSNRTSSLNDTNTIFQNYFRKSIVSKAPFEGMALGIAGDTTSNVLWRLQNGEGIVSSPKVWWLLIGTNDIIHHKCRPDVVFLGIQRILQELSQRYPNSIIVVNGVLPASLRPDGRLITPPPSDSNHHHNNKNQTNDNHKNHHDDGDDENVWTVIQRLNQDLEKFCRFHKYFYVDSSHLFLANIGNANFLRKEKILMKELMNDFIHPTPQGYQIWAKDIVDQLQSLLEPDTFDD